MGEEEREALGYDQKSAGVTNRTPAGEQKKKERKKKRDCADEKREAPMRLDKKLVARLSRTKRTSLAELCLAQTMVKARKVMREGCEKVARKE